VVEVVFGEGGVRGRSITRLMEAPLARGKIDSTWGKRQSSGGHKKKNREKLCPKGSFK
jgi:hypothetical protein